MNELKSFNDYQVDGDVIFMTKTDELYIVPIGQLMKFWAI